MKEYFNQREAMGVALISAGNCALSDGIENLKGRLEEIGCYDAATQALELLRKTCDTVFDTCKDEDYRIGLERKIGTYHIGLKHVKPECKELHVVGESDMQTLIGHSLNFCDLECPCVSMEEDGARTIDKRLVKACEMRKMYKRLMLTEGVSAECPYSMLI